MIYSAILLAGQTIAPSSTTPKVVPNTCTTEQVLSAFKAGVQTEREENSLNIGKNSKIQLQLLVEPNLQDADVYRFAVAEVAKGYFDSQLQFVSKSDVILYVTGTDDLHGTQGIDVSVRGFVLHPVSIGGKVKMVTGGLLLSESGFTVTGAKDFRSQRFRENVYKVLANLLSRIDEAKDVGSPSANH